MGKQMSSSRHHVEANGSAADINMRGHDARSHWPVKSQAATEGWVSFSGTQGLQSNGSSAQPWSNWGADSHPPQGIQLPTRRPPPPPPVKVTLLQS